MNWSVVRRVKLLSFAVNIENFPFFYFNQHLWWVCVCTDTKVLKATKRLLALNLLILTNGRVLEVRIVLVSSASTVDRNTTTVVRTYKNFLLWRNRFIKFLVLSLSFVLTKFNVVALFENGNLFHFNKTNKGVSWDWRANIISRNQLFRILCT